MCPVEQDSAIAVPEEFAYKTEDPVIHHINRVNRSVCTAFPEFPHNPYRQDDIEDALRFSRRPPERHTEEMIPQAATGKDAVDPGAHQRKDHADRAGVKYHLCLHTEDLCHQQVEPRHKEHSAEETHIADRSCIKSRLRYGKRLHAQHAPGRMGNGHGNGCIPFQLEQFLVFQQPEKSKGRTDCQQDNQRM